MAVACFLGLRTSPFENFLWLREASSVRGIWEVAPSGARARGAGAGEEAGLVFEEGMAMVNFTKAWGLA